VRANDSLGAWDPSRDAFAGRSGVPSLVCPPPSRRPEGRNKRPRIRSPARMKRFATELSGKTVMTEDGQVLGVLDDFLVDTKTGRIQSLVVSPAESVETRLFKTDPKGRLLLSFRSLKAVKDVIVTQLAD